MSVRKMDNEKIGNYIKELRTKKGLSQNELSEKLHVTRQAISNWETGKAAPDSSILVLLSDLFNVSINIILSGGSKENDIEKVALSLIDENNKKIRKIKKIIGLFISSIMLFSLAFLSYYFISNYNSIKIYKITSESNNFALYNGLLLKTKNKMYIKLNDVKNQNNLNIKNYELYLVKNNEEKIIYKTNDTNKLISYSMEENIVNLILNSNFKMYLKVIYDDNKIEKLTLKFEEDYTNNIIFDTRNNKSTKEEKNNIVELEHKEEIKEEILPEGNNIKEEPVINIVYEKPKEDIVDNTTEEEKKKIELFDYEEAKNIINTKGIDNNSMKSITLFDNTKVIIISLNNDIIYIDCIDGLNIESFIYAKNNEHIEIDYKKILSGIEECKIKVHNEDELNLYPGMVEDLNIILNKLVTEI